MRTRTLSRTLARLATAAATGLLLAGAAHAQPSDPAVPTIDSFDKTLLETMKAADDLGLKGRYKKLEPAIQKTFNLPVMARYAVGDKWNGFSDAEHQTLIDAFTRLTVASYAHNFDGYEGESFEVNPTVQTRNQDKIVQAKLIRPKDKPVTLNYRMRLADGNWKVIDVYFNGISQLTIRRNDLAATAMVGGAKALTKNMNNQADKLLKTKGD
jgi:phospholipid transport system substrate-binding protein